MQVEQVVENVVPSRVRRVSWGAIFAGVFLATVLQVMFTLLGAALGFGPLRPSDQANPAQAMAIGSGIWLLVTGLVSIWIGACVAGRLSGGPLRADGMIHGLITWSVSTVIAFGLLATTIGGIVGGAGSLVNRALTSDAANSPGGPQALNTLGQGVQSMLPSAGSILSPTGRTQGNQVPGRLTDLLRQDPELAGAVAKMEAQGGAPSSETDRDQVVRLLTTKHNLTDNEAQDLVNQWDQQLQQMKGQASQKIHEAGHAVARGVASGAFWGFLALFLGLLVSAWGGWAGTATLARRAAYTT